MMVTQSGKDPLRGEVWSVNLDPVVGHEQGGVRPALIVSDDLLNRSPSGLLTVAPITGTHRGIPAHVEVNPPEAGLTKPSFIMTDQLRTVSKRRLGRRWGALALGTMAQVEDCLRMVLGL